METKWFQESLKQVEAQRNGFLILSLGLLLLCFVLSSMLATAWKTKRVFLVPPTLSQKAWVSASQFDATYIQDMAEYFAMIRLNVQPKNTKAYRELLLRWVDAKSYESFSHALDTEIRDILTRGITSVFSLKGRAKVDTSHLKAIVRGTIQKTIAGQHLDAKKSSWQLTFANQGGKLLLKKFKEIQQ